MGVCMVWDLELGSAWDLELGSGWDLELGSGWDLELGIWDLATTLNPPHNSLSRLMRPQRPPDVLRDLVLAHRAQHGGVDRRRFVDHAESLEHQRRRRDRANRIRDILSGELRRRPVD